ncbi:Sodium-dependent noradrenaline transporter [Bulinus truncatus]|nr:Sodium-dependent noradrenaline transporter [Bulinus truncatus]
MTHGHGRTTPCEDSSLSVNDEQMKDHLYTESQVEMMSLLNGHSVEVKVDDRSQRKDGNEQADSNSRHTWARKLQYILSVVGFCVGMGNVLRFPYLCIRNGGGAFLIPYFLCLSLCGIPLFYLEVGLGQFMSRGAQRVWNICPLFKGIGVSMNMLSFMSGWYYSVIFAYILVYLVNSFRSPLPWSQCGQEWNTDHCVPTGITAMDYGNIDSRANDSQSNSSDHWPTSVNKSISASKEFWITTEQTPRTALNALSGKMIVHASRAQRYNAKHHKAHGQPLGYCS